MARGGRRFAFTRRQPADPVPAEYGAVSGGRPFAPLATPNVQGGYFDDVRLNQFPARWEGLMLRCGVEGLKSGWYTPTISVVPTFQQSQYPQRDRVGTQRFGQGYTGGVGPVNVAAMNAAVVAAQIRQSGLSAMSWAKDLTPKS
jgi:hypothetical protein